MPIISIQAPELLGATSIANISQRVEFYRDLLIAELAEHNPCVHIIGYSLGGILAYGLAQSMKDTKLFCASLCLVDPPPLSAQRGSEIQKSYLCLRAEILDSTCGNYLNKKTNFL